MSQDNGAQRRKTAQPQMRALPRAQRSEKSGRSGG